jgi:DNA-binding NarL/FixJ family response regulator
MKTKVVVIDDHTSVRQMLGRLLELDGIYQVVGEGGTGLEALKLWRKLRPDVLIVDLMLPELSGAEVVRQVRAERGATRVLIYSGTLHQDLVLNALRARPHGFVHKEDPLDTFREALRAVSRGCSYFTPWATRLLDQANDGEIPSNTLTPQERTVLQMIAEGRTSKEIAGRLNISPKTVEHYRASVMDKLGLHDVASLTRYAVQNGLVGID